MNIKLTSGSMLQEIVLPDDHIAGFVRPDNSVGTDVYSDQMIIDSIDNPIGCKKLSERILPNQSIAIVVDDATRPTPTKRILPMLLSKLEALGIDKSKITITIGTGLHRSPTDQEKENILGFTILNSYNVADNDARNPDCFALAGKTSETTSIYLNKRVLDADHVITIGMVKSHAFAGFTGGAKSILPAVASQKTIHENHCFHNIEYPRGVLGSCEMSGTRKGMEAAARLVDPFIINVVLSGNGEIIFVAAGDVVKAHRKAVEIYSKSAMRTVPEEVDIALVFGGHAGSVNFYQALFGCNVVKTTQRPILKKNGTVILFAECREGSGSKLFEKMMPAFPTPEAILTHLSTGEVVDDQWAVQFLATFIRDINVFVVSTGLTRELAEILHVNLFGSAKAAFDEAVKRAPSDYRIAIIENPDVLVVNKE
ncbi:MAG: nickel-dependent lactate racemase [Sphaerochaeta sp.]|jgi:nickel-dependent lactate racemase|nr:nickel-dependent lactate racemase [Sphaerochaeta sp.]PKL27758.1 MAG: hypothetical protein CVV46_09755 [Spirochaetae bacterium HGW-Spirochaetae-2]